MSKRPCSAPSQRKCRRTSFFAAAYQTLEPRQMLTTTVFLDFGLGFENGQLTTTVDEFQNVNGTFEGNFRGTDLEDSDAGISPDDVLNLQINSRFDFDSDGDVDADDTLLLAEATADVVRRVYQPFAIDVEIVNSSSLDDVRDFLNRNGDDVGNRDAYVFAVEAFRGSDGASVGELTGSFGIASGADLFSAQSGDGNQPINRNDEVAFTFIDNIANFGDFFSTPAAADEQRAFAARIGYVSAHEAGHTLGLLHNEDRTNEGPQVISDLQLMALNSNIRAGVGADRAFFHFNPRFDLPLQSGSFGFGNDYDNLAGDPNIGLRDDDANGVPDFAYVTGTGAHDLIELEAVDQNTINVTVTPFSDGERENGIDVSPETYSIVMGVDSDGDILIDAGFNNDEIRIIGDINANVQVRGGHRTVRSDGSDSVADSDRLLIDGTNIGGPLSYRSLVGQFDAAVGVQSFDGEVVYGNTRVTFSEFEADGGGVEVVGFPIVSATDVAVASDLQLISAGSTSSSRLESTLGNGFVPLTFTGAIELTVDLGSNDEEPTANSFVLVDSLAGSTLRSLNFVGGDGDDNIDLSATSADFISNDGIIHVAGNLGNDKLIASSFQPSIEISARNAGTSNGLSFEDIENIESAGPGTVFSFIDQGRITGVVTSSQATIDARSSSLRSLIVEGTASTENGLSGLIILAQSNAEVDDEDTAGSFVGVVEFIGNEANNGNEYRNADVATTWSINGGSETVTTETGTVTLENFNRYIGGDAIDTFNVGAVALSTVLAGGGDNDQFNINQIGTGVVSIDGGDGSDGLTGPQQSMRYFISGEGTGSAGENINFTNTESVVAGGLNDSFVVGNGGVGVLLDGGGGDNELIGPNLSRVWELTTQYGGQIERSEIEFENIQSIVGGDKRDQFKLSRQRLDQTISGGGGIDQINGPDAPRQWNVTGEHRGNVVASNVDFVSIESLAGGSAADSFNLSPGVLSTAISGGQGRDTVNGADVENTFSFDGQRRGQVVNSAVTFRSIELANGGQARDRFELNSTGAINTNIDGGGGHDTITGPNLPRRFTITSRSRGFINFSNVIFDRSEFLIGGDDYDQFVFASDSSAVLGIDGGGATNSLDYSNRSSINLAISGLGDQDGFDGIGSAIGTVFKNIGQVLGSLNSAQDSFRGAATDSDWIYHPVRTSYITENRELSIFNFETLVGNQANDNFRVFQPRTSSLTIAGGGQGEGIGDSLRMEFANNDNTRYLRNSDSSGEFRFNNSRPVLLSGIETLDNYDYGDAVNSYGTSIDSDGARHRIGSQLRLGNNVDPERNGISSGDSMGDDSNGTINDEDGVILPETIVASFDAAAFVFASGEGILDAWIDFNINGRFDPNEKIADSVSVSEGFNRVEFNVPFNGTNAGITNARFRISSAGNLLPTGTAADGEVEDYQLTIARVEAGFAGSFEDPTRPGSGDTLLAISGTNADDNIFVSTTDRVMRASVNGRLVSVTDFNLVGTSSNRLAISGLGGDDTISVRSSIRSEIRGGAGDDVIQGGNANDLLVGGEGNDQLFGNGGADILRGESGGDILRGGNQADVIVGGTGNDRLLGGAGNDTLIGGLGRDQILGQSGSDLILGGSSIYDTQNSQLVTLRSFWADQDRSYQLRTLELRRGSGDLAETGILFANRTTVFSDSSIDNYFGGEGQDAFFPLEVTDLVNDRESNEISVS